MGLVERVQKRIEGRFKEALGPLNADAALMSVLGKVLSRPELASRVYGEGEIFLVKSALFMSGVRLDESAYEGVGTTWKEDLGQRHYDPDARRSRDRAVPHALLMPHQFCIPLSIQESSPWHLEATVKALEIWERHGLSADRHSSQGLHYADLARMRASLRADQAREPGRDLSRDLRYRLAVEGRMPE
jgi:hypothetical protein